MLNTNGCNEFLEIAVQQFVNKESPPTRKR
jgi:hypothetical protein